MKTVLDGCQTLTDFDRAGRAIQNFLATRPSMGKQNGVITRYPEGTTFYIWRTPTTIQCVKEVRKANGKA